MQIGKIKKMLSKKKHKKEMKKSKDFLDGKLAGAKEEHEKINQQIEIENKNALALESLSKKQKSNAAIIEKNRIIQTMKDEANVLNQQFEDYRSLHSIENKPLEEKVKELKQNLKYEIKELKHNNLDWESMIEKTEDVLLQIGYVTDKFKPSFLEAIKSMDTVLVLADDTKEMLRYLKSFQRKVAKLNGKALRKVPALRIKKDN